MSPSHSLNASDLVPTPTTDAARRTYAARLASATKRLARMAEVQAAEAKARKAPPSARSHRAPSATLPDAFRETLRAETNVLRRVARALLTLPSDARARVLDMARSHLTGD